MKDPYTEYRYRDVDPVWDEALLGACEQVADMLVVLELPVLHRQMLRAALPGRKLRVSLSGTGKGASGNGETAAFGEGLRRMDRKGMIRRESDELVHVLDVQALYEFVLHSEQPRMPRDGYLRALAWAQGGDSPLHARETRRLQQVLAERDEEGSWE